MGGHRVTLHLKSRSSLTAASEYPQTPAWVRWLRSWAVPEPDLSSNLDRDVSRSNMTIEFLGSKRYRHIAHASHRQQATSGMLIQPFLVMTGSEGKSDTCSLTYTLTSTACQSFASVSQSSAKAYVSLVLNRGFFGCRTERKRVSSRSYAGS